MAVRHISAAQAHGLSRDDLHAALEFVRRIAAAGDPDEFATETLRGLLDLIRCDYGSYVETNPAAGRAMALTEPREAMFAEAPEALARNLGGHPLVQYYLRTGQNRALFMSDFLSDRQFRRTTLYDELFRPAETDYLLSATLPVPHGLVVGFSLHRKARDFGERDRALVDLLEPHLAQAYERSLLRAAVGALEGEPARPEPSIVVLGLDGDVLWMSREAERALEHHFGPKDPGGALPAELHAWLVAGGHGPFRAATDARRLRVDPLGDRPAALLLTERAIRPSEEALGRLGLSVRESQVLALVALGQTNAEIALALSVSPGTVKRHLEHVYAKLDVHTRTAAAAAAWAASGSLSHAALE